MTPDYAGAITVPDGNYFLNRLGYKPLYIIVHGTAGGTSAVVTANYFASTVGTGNPVSSHYIIDQVGTIVQCIAEKDGSFANGAYSQGHASFWNENVNPNLITISIEHVKQSTDNSDALTAAQQAASFKLIADICKRWSIPRKMAVDASGGITGHYSIDPVNRARCPGSYPWDALIMSLQENSMLELTDPTIAKYFKASPNGWLCSNGVNLIGDNLKFYRSNNGFYLYGLPLTNEIYLKPFPNTAIVVCERGILCYDPGRIIDTAPIPGTVYPMHLTSGPAYDLLTQSVATVYQAQIATLQGKLESIKSVLLS